MSVIYAADSDHFTVQRPVPGHEEYWSEIEFLADGRVYGVRVFPLYSGLDIGAGVTARLLRSIRISDHEEEFRQSVEFHQRAAAVAPDLQSAADRQLLSIGEQFLAEPRPGQRGRQDLFYAQLAELYVTLLATHRDPVPTIADRECLNVHTVRNLMSEVRKRELLTRVGPGRPGGELTAKARELLSGAQ